MPRPTIKARPAVEDLDARVVLSTVHALTLPTVHPAVITRVRFPHNPLSSAAMTAAANPGQVRYVSAIGGRGIVAPDVSSRGVRVAMGGGPIASATSIRVVRPAPVGGGGGGGGIAATAGAANPTDGLTFPGVGTNGGLARRSIATGPGVRFLS